MKGLFVKMKISNNLKAYFIIVSTIIGLGIFVLPYAFSVSGYYFFFWLIFWFLAFFILHLIFGEILFQTKENHNLPGLSALYLHPKLKHLVWIFDYFGMLGVFLIYFIALEKFWSLITPLNPLLIKLIFAFLNIYFLLKDLPIFARFETTLSLGILFVFLIISGSLAFNFNLENLKIALLNVKDPLLPYGILLFAFAGTSALPVVYDLIGKDKKSYLKINFFSLLTISLIYLIYTLVVVGFLGINVSEESLQSLAPYFSKIFLISTVLLVTLNITFVDMAFYLKRGLIYDYNLNPKLANIVLIFSILPLAFLKPFGLIKVIDFISSVFLGFNLLIITLIYLRLKQKEYFQLPNFLVVVLALIFILGIIYGIFPK